MTKETTPNDMFNMLLDEVGEDFDASFDRLTLKKSISHLGRYVMQEGFKTLLTERKQRERARLKARPAEQPPQVRAKVSKKMRAIAQSAIEDLYNLWQLGSVKLGDADRSLLESEAHREANLADGHDKNQRFYSELAKLVPEGKTLRESVDIHTADEIRVRIYKEATT